MENQPQKPSALYSAPLCESGLVQRTAEEKKQIIAQWKQSGLSRKSFCRQQNLSYHSLTHWTRKKRNRSKSVSSDFVPLQVKHSAEQVFAQIETGGKRIQLYQPVTAYFLKQLLR